MQANILGLSSPARFTLNELEDGLKKHQEIWRESGVKTKLYPSCFVQNHYETLTPSEKAEELLEVAKLNHQVIISLRGGYSTNFMLDHLDINELSKYQNTLVGHSDLTILLNFLAYNTKWNVYHGPLFTSVLENDDYTITNLIEQIKRENGEKITLKSVTELELYNMREVSGEIIGGNLCLITGAIGTKYELKLEDRILLIEDVSEPDFKIDGMMWQLVNTYDFRKIKAVIIGSFKGCNYEYNEKQRGVKRIMENYLLDYNIPILLNYSSSHASTMTSLPLNKTITIDEKGQIIY